MLIYHVLCCFSVLVCCRSLVQFVAQMGEIEQKMESWPLQCDRAHYARAQGAHSSACLVSCISRVALAGPMLHRFNTCTVAILKQLRAIERNAVELNAYYRTQMALRSNAMPTIKRMRDCDQSHP